VPPVVPLRVGLGVGVRVLLCGRMLLFLRVDNGLLLLLGLLVMSLAVVMVL
jgi:hypothetical protein